MELWKLPIDEKERQRVISFGLEMFRNYQNLDKMSIKADKVKGVNKFKNFTAFQFKRGYEYIEEYRCCTSFKKSLIAVLINRKLQVYDYITDKLLFEIEISNVLGQGSIGDPRNTFFFMDNDQVIVIQDGQSRIVLVNVIAQTEIFSKILKSLKNEQITAKIEESMLVKLINPKLVNPAGLFLSTEEQATQSEESDEALELLGVAYLETSFEIKNMFHSRNMTDFVFLAIMSQSKFMIYEVCEDDTQGCDKVFLFEINFKKDPEISKFGAPLAADFDDAGF